MPQLLFKYFEKPNLKKSNYKKQDMSALRKWLETPDAEKILSNVAKSVLLEALSRKLCFRFLGHEVIHNHEKTELLRDIQSNLPFSYSKINLISITL